MIVHNCRTSAHQAGARHMCITDSILWYDYKHKTHPEDELVLSAWLCNESQEQARDGLHGTMRKYDIRIL